MPTSTARKNIYRAALAHRNFRWLMTAYAQSTVGDFLYLTAITATIWTATGSATWVTVMVVLRALPLTVLPPLAGVLADRMDKLQLLIMLDLGRAVVMAAMALTTALSGPVALLILMAVLVNTISTPQRPATVGLLPRLVPEADFAAANAVEATVDSLGLLAGPAIGAVLLLLGVPAVAFGVNAATFLVSAACLTQVHPRSLVSKTPETATPEADVDGLPVPDALRAESGGLRSLLADKGLLVATAAVVAACYTLGATTVLFVVLSAQRLGTGAQGVGWLQVAVGVGGLAGTQLANRISSAGNVGRLIIGLLVVTGVGLLGLAATGQPLAAYVFAAVFGAGYLLLEILGTTFMQRVLDPAVLGRATGLVDAAAYGAILLGSLVSGPIAQLAGVGWAFTAAAVVALVVAALGYGTAQRLDRAVAPKLAALRPREEMLRRVGALAGADEAGIERLAEALTVDTVSAGTVVVNSGDPATDFYVVVAGQLRVEVEGDVRPDGLPLLGPGDFFGEIGLLQQRPRTATVIADTDVEFYRVPGQAFLEVVHAVPALTTSFGEVATQRLNRASPAGVR